MTYDAIIIGGGLVGGVAAIAMASKGLHVAVVDRDTRESLLDPKLDGRTTAVSYGSQQIFEKLNIWAGAAHDAEPILNIKVCEGDSPWGVYYHHTDVGDHPMGYIVENRTLRQAIFDRAEAMADCITWIAPAELTDTRREAHQVVVTLADGQELLAPVLVGAEGRASPSRQAAGIRTQSWSYDQKALVCIVEHELPHEGTAWEIFYPDGPVAFLPLKNHPETGAHRSGIVWTQSPSTIERLLKMSDGELAAHMESQFPHYGDLKPTGQRWSYPLGAQVAYQYCDHRYVMVGDAAHVMHPVAGQGVNLGWRDAAELAEFLGAAKRTGADLGSLTLLEAYQRQRRPDMASLVAMTDGMIRLFGNDKSSLHFLRNTGLGVVNAIPPLKRKLMRQAMGMRG